MVKIKYIGKCLLVETKSGKKIIVFGDLHLGYEQALNEGGVFVSRKMYDEMISELNRVFESVGGRVDEVVLLGDVKHGFGGIMKQEREDTIHLVNWLLERCGRVIVTEGNHDKIIEPIFRGKDRIELKDSYIVEGMVFAHGDGNIDEFWSKENEVIIIGHWHPAVELVEGVKKEKYKCFLEGKVKKKKLIVMPSFLDNYGGIDIRNTDFNDVFGVSGEKFKVIVAGEKENLDGLDFGELGKIKKY